MRRIAVIATSLLAVLPAFAQTAPKAAAPAAAPAAAAAPAPTAGPHPKSAAENDAVVAMGKAADPDARIKAVDALMTTYPDTDYKSVALLMEAESYHQKKDEAKAILYGEQSLEADAKSFETLLLLADIYSQSTRSTDLDMDDRVAKADKYAKSALAILATAEKPNPALSDTDWANAKRGEESRAWEALGLTAILRKKFDEAKTNIQKGMDLYPDPVDMLRVERAYIDAKRFDDAVAWADKAAASPAADDNIKRIAAQDKARAQALKKQQQ